MLLKSLCLVFAFGFATHAHAETPVIADTQSAEVLININEGEIDAGKLAEKKAQNGELKDFAKMMVDTHKQNEKDTKDVVKKNKIGTKNSDMAKAIKAEAKATYKELKSKDKASFDKAYITAQVAMHEKALSTLKEQLIPAAQNADYKAHLEKTADAVAQHLEHAKELDAKIQ